VAAVVVAAARHIDPALTVDTAVKELKNRPATRAAVDAIVSRAPPQLVPGGSATLGIELRTARHAMAACSSQRRAAR
jgi:hypothetical protein